MATVLVELFIDLVEPLLDLGEVESGRIEFNVQFGGVRARAVFQIVETCQFLLQFVEMLEQEIGELPTGDRWDYILT